MNMINEKIEERTSRILINNDMYNIPVDPVKIAKTYNIIVYKMKLPNAISGAIRYEKNKKAITILVSADDTIEKQRFTVAEELGYYILFKEKLEQNEIHLNILDHKEDEENKDVEYFAGALLMNKTLLENAYESNNTISELAELFNVSVTSMTLRLQVLGLI